MSKHTKGPWSVNHWSKGDRGVSCQEKKNGINYFTGDAVDSPFFGIRSKIDPPQHSIQGSFEGAHIAEIPDFSHQSQANAILISKAPAMYDLLRSSHDMLLRLQSAIKPAHSSILSDARETMKEILNLLNTIDNG